MYEIEHFAHCGRGLDDSICWVWEIVCILNNAQGIHCVLFSVLRTNQHTHSAGIFLPSQNLLGISPPPPPRLPPITFLKMVF